MGNMTGQPRRGCFQVFKTGWTIFFLLTALFFTSVNLFFSNIFGETCGYIHPFIFEVQVTVIDDSGRMASNSRAIPAVNNDEVQALMDDGLLTSAFLSALDTFLRVYDANMTTMLAFNDDSNGLTSELSAFSVDSNQTVVIELATFGNDSEGRYSLFVQDTGEADTISASNNDMDVFVGELTNAGILDSADLLSGVLVEGEIHKDERVQYTVALEAGRSYLIDLNGTEGFEKPERIATDWSACLQYYGLFSDSGFSINANGSFWFLPDSLADSVEEACEALSTVREKLDQCVQSSVRVSATGRIIFFVLLAILVVALPIFIVDTLEGQRETVWYLFLLLVAIQATTTAMLFLHLGTVSGIEALSEFGYGIFGGITTGSALVFIDKLAHRAGDSTSMVSPPDNESQDSE